MVAPPSAPVLGPPPVIEPVSRYEYHQVLGHGSFACVVDATDCLTGRRLAIKFYRDPKTGQPTDATEDVVREVGVLGDCQHDNIVRLLRVLPVHDTTDSIALVMERAHCSLWDQMRHLKSPLPLPLVKRYMRELLSAVNYCHTRRIVHRDLKPENMLIFPDGTLKVGDFGNARHLDDGADNIINAYEAVTLWYRSPEQLLGAPFYGTPSDIWSCGCILAEMLAGQPLFAGRTEASHIRRIFTLLGTPTLEQWPSLAALEVWTGEWPEWPARSLQDCFPPSVPDIALDLLGRLLQYDPVRRPRAWEAMQHQWFDF